MISLLNFHAKSGSSHLMIINAGSAMTMCGPDVGYTSNTSDSRC